jgi:hypothetical protein
VRYSLFLPEWEGKINGSSLPRLLLANVHSYEPLKGKNGHLISHNASSTQSSPWYSRIAVCKLNEIVQTCYQLVLKVKD